MKLFFAKYKPKDIDNLKPENAKWIDKTIEFAENGDYAVVSPFWIGTRKLLGKDVPTFKRVPMADLEELFPQRNER